MIEAGNALRDCRKSSNCRHSGSSVLTALSLLYRLSATRASSVNGEKRSLGSTCATSLEIRLRRTDAATHRRVARSSVTVLKLAVFQNSFSLPLPRPCPTAIFWIAANELPPDSVS